MHSSHWVLVLPSSTTSQGVFDWVRTCTNPLPPSRDSDTLEIVGDTGYSLYTLTMTRLHMDGENVSRILRCEKRDGGKSL